METNAHRPRQSGTFRPHRLCLPLLAACLVLPAIAQADPPLYRVTSLGKLSGDPNGGSSEAYALNDLGQVVGESLVQIQGSHPVHAFLWLPVEVAVWGLDQGMHDLGLIEGDPVAANSEGRDINESGQIVGTSNSRAFVWFPEYFGEPFPVKELWPLPEFGTGEGTEGWALDDGNPLRVVGWGVDGPCPDDARFNRALGFVWISSEPTQLDEIEPPNDIHDWTDTKIFAINPDTTSRRVLGGVAEYCGPFNDSNEYIAIGRDSDLADVTISMNLPWPFGGPYSKARDVTDEGEFVGWGKDEDNQSLQRALYWETVTSAPVNLHTEGQVPAGDATVAQAIGHPAPDGLPHVVGWNKTANTALLWKRDGQGEWSAQNLNELIGTHAQDDWILREAYDINNSTWIVGWGLYEDQHRAFLLSTAKDCPWDLDFDGDVDTGDLLILLGTGATARKVRSAGRTSTWTAMWTRPTC